MPIKQRLLLIFLLASSRAFCQFDYDLYEVFADSALRRLHTNVESYTEYQKLKKGRWMIASQKEFNELGLPVRFLQYGVSGKVDERRDFFYSSPGHIQRIDAYKEGKLAESTELQTNDKVQVTAYTVYVFASLDGEKMLVSKKYFEYNPDGTLSKAISLEGDKLDTGEVNYYDAGGRPLKTIFPKSKFISDKSRVEYTHNADMTEMVERHYEYDTVSRTVIHKYNSNKKEVERIDPHLSEKPLYWKYDDAGRVLETNEGVFMVVHHTYDATGRKVRTVAELVYLGELANDGIDGLGKKIYLKYEYKLRK